MPSKAKSSESVQTSNKNTKKAAPEPVVKEPVKEPVKAPVKEPVKAPVKEPVKATKKEKPTVTVETVDSDEDDDDNSIIELSDDSDSDSSDDSDSDSDSSDSELDSVDSESVTMNATDAKTAADTEDVKEKQPKKEKPTFKQVLDELERLQAEEKKILVELSNLNKQVKALELQKASNDRLVNKQVALLPKAYEDGITKARKEKKKRTNNARSGILKEAPIPELLIKFLDLKEGTLLARPAVASRLNNKFKDLGLKKGQDTILDKKTAKMFGLEEGHVIRFTQVQTFLKEIYDKEKTNEVAL
jgi:hypothetical protein